MGGAIHHAGPSGSGAAVKLMVNAFLLVQVATLGEIIGLARAAGLDEESAIGIVMKTPLVSPVAKGLAEAMLAEKYEPLFPIEMVEKDLSYVVKTARAGGSDAPVAEAVRKVFAEGISEGLADLNMTAIVKQYRD
jgi:3-hydroxyisobutyrate dehydrogenase